MSQVEKNHFTYQGRIKSMTYSVEMGLSNRFSRVKPRSLGCVPAGCMVVSAVGMSRRMLGVAGRAFNVDDALCRNDGATPSTEWPGPRPGRDASSVRTPNAIRWMSGCGSWFRLEDLAGLEHCMHDHR